MAKKHKHEEHLNHEAWAIPYGDLVTLLLAFFVVMYAISSVNEGKYRVLADALSEAFGGPPKTISPLQLGTYQKQGSHEDTPSPMTQMIPRGAISASPLRDPSLSAIPQSHPGRPQMRKTGLGGDPQGRAEKQLEEIATKVEKALAPLIDADLVTVRRAQLWLEVEIKTDILFDSGSATPKTIARDTIERVAVVLDEFPNAIRVEGHTDDRPIQTSIFPSNWELSAARAASVVHVLVNFGIESHRLAVVGYAQERPKADNATVEGRNQNRRVVLVILADPGAPMPGSTQARESALPDDTTKAG